MKETDEKFFVGIKALIKNNQGNVLLLKSGPAERRSTLRRTDFWDLPGGKIKKREKDVKETLKREVSEELGVNKRDIRFIGLFDASVSKFKTTHGKRNPLLLITFLCSLKNSTNIFRLTKEHSRYGWYDLDSASKMLSTKFSDGFVNKLKR